MGDPVRDFLQDDAGDLAAVKGDFALVAGAAAVPQGIRIRVRTFLTDIWLDESQGVDWLGSILVKPANPLVARELVREAIADTPDVTDVVGSALQLDTDRHGQVDYRVDTVYSKAPFVDHTNGLAR